ncbi:hypothetical protein [Dyadobacter sp. 3J3]|uniref:hypothetical protein n=1 Tax=Dyadobacter sp. 3J3 TaxID=2606600 RepID=UPI00135715A1|nr:hypothetical protein [Dyadobacter sp. 3J3]
MHGFINLDSDTLIQCLGREIEYYELWDPELGDFKCGRSFIHGTYLDDNGSIKIYADLIWGDSLDQIKEGDGGFCFANGSYIYLAPAPFQIFRITWLNNSGVQEKKIIPAETYMDVELTARLFTTEPYQTVRINLDGTVYNPILQ